MGGLRYNLRCSQMRLISHGAAFVDVNLELITVAAPYFVGWPGSCGEGESNRRISQLPLQEIACPETI